MSLLKIYVDFNVSKYDFKQLLLYIKFSLCTSKTDWNKLKKYSFLISYSKYKNHSLKILTTILGSITFKYDFYTKNKICFGLENKELSLYKNFSIFKICTNKKPHIGVTIKLNLYFSVLLEF